MPLRDEVTVVSATVHTPLAMLETSVVLQPRWSQL